MRQETAETEDATGTTAPFLRCWSLCLLSSQRNRLSWERCGLLEALAVTSRWLPYAEELGVFARLCSWRTVANLIPKTPELHFCRLIGPESWFWKYQLVLKEARGGLLFLISSDLFYDVVFWFALCECCMARIRVHLTIRSRKLCVRPVLRKVSFSFFERNNVLRCPHGRAVLVTWVSWLDWQRRLKSFWLVTVRTVL